LTAHQSKKFRLEYLASRSQITKLKSSE